MLTTLTRMNPTNMPDAGAVGYSQISLTNSSRLAFVSGQVAWRTEGQPVPEDLSEQTVIVIENLQRALTAIGAASNGIVQMRIYMTELTHETQNIVMAQVAEFLGGAKPSLTGIGVLALASPELKLEIEMVVQIPSEH